MRQPLVRLVATVGAVVLCLPASFGSVNADTKGSVMPEGDNSTESCKEWVIVLSENDLSPIAKDQVIEELADLLSIHIFRRVEILDAYIAVVCGDNALKLQNAKKDLGVRLAFPNFGANQLQVSDAHSQQWYLDNVGQEYFVASDDQGAYTNMEMNFPIINTPGKDINWATARNTFPNIDGSGVTVAVIDTGVDTDSSEFAGRVSPNRASISCELNIGSDVTDYNGHGTRVASLIGSAEGNGGIVGVAPQSIILPLKPINCPLGSVGASGMGNVAQYAMAVVMAYQSAQVINLSNGVNISEFFDYVGPGIPTGAYIDALTFYEEYIDAAAESGAIIVASSGNGGDGGEEELGFEAGDPLFPASFQHVTSVGSIRSDGSISSFSQYNQWVDVAAPGERIIALRSSDTINCGSAGNYGCFVGLDGSGGHDSSYSVANGTSFSAPLVSGAAALAKQKWPRLTSDQFEVLVRQTADDAGTPGYDPYYGAGTLNLERLLSYNFPVSVEQAGLSTSSVLAGGSTTASVLVDNMEGDSDIESVTVDLAPIGGSIQQLSRVSEAAYSGTISVPSNTQPGSYTLSITARDLAGHVGGSTVNLTVLAENATPPPTTNITEPTEDVSVEITTPKRGKDVVTKKDRYSVRGEVGSSVAFLELNGDPVSLTPGSATWSVEIDLDKGDNDLEFVAYDVARTSSDRADVTITLDTKAPGDVRGLKANGMTLTWESPKDKDVAGYRVYRQEGKKWKKVKSVTKEEFTVTAGGTYAVTAEDEAGNEADVDDAPTVTTGSSFEDVPPTHFASNAISSLSSRGVISGNGGRFFPDKLVTRAEFAKMLAGAMGEESSGSASFEDVPSSHSLSRYIASVTSRGWASGQGRKFFPDRPITRMEAARMIVRAKGLSPSSSCQLTDISNAEERGYACALYAAGIATGQGGQFFPSRFLTRAEAAKMLASI